MVACVMHAGWEGAGGGHGAVGGGHSPRPGHPGAFIPPMATPPPSDWQASDLSWVIVCTEMGDFILKGPGPTIRWF